MVLGRIPMSKALEYAERIGLDADLVEPFWRIISAMDDAYSTWMSGEFNRTRRGQHEAHGQTKQVPDAKPERKTLGRSTRAKR